MLRQHEEMLVGRLERAAALAAEDADTVVAAVQAKDWAKANEAYEACEKRLVDLTAAARMLSAKLKEIDGAAG